MSERSVILRMLADEIEANEHLAGECQWAAQTIAGLVEDNEDLRADWAEEYQEQRIRIGRMEGLIAHECTRARIAEESAAHWKAQYETEHSHKLTIAQEGQAHAKELEAELLEERRQKVAAFERNAQLEGKPFALDEAAQALEAIIRKQNDGELIRSLYDVLKLLRGPRAPSVPRREAPL